MQIVRPISPEGSNARRGKISEQSHIDRGGKGIGGAPENGFLKKFFGQAIEGI